MKIEIKPVSKTHEEEFAGFMRYQLIINGVSQKIFMAPANYNAFQLLSVAAIAVNPTYAQPRQFLKDTFNKASECASKDLEGFDKAIEMLKEKSKDLDEESKKLLYENIKDLYA